MINNTIHEKLKIWQREFHLNHDGTYMLRKGEHFLFHEKDGRHQNNSIH
jgi:hypothetical protein